MRRQVSLGLILLGCLAFLLCTSTASGQAVYGGIVGTVTDPQGNAVAGAKVTGERIQEAEKSARPRLQRAWEDVQQGTEVAGASVQHFFQRLFGP